MLSQGRNISQKSHISMTKIKSHNIKWIKRLVYPFVSRAMSDLH